MKRYGKLTIGCDDKFYKNRYIEYEIRRQRAIEEELGCESISFNPDDLKS